MVPSSACDVCVASIEFVCVCIHPPTGSMYVYVCMHFDKGLYFAQPGNNFGAGYKNLESKLALEMQALPTYMVDRPAEILSTFERQVKIAFLTTTAITNTTSHLNT